jgi:hypothetical protein
VFWTVMSPAPTGEPGQTAQSTGLFPLSTLFFQST